MSEIKNAKVERAVIEIEDHGILTGWLYLSYGGSGQGFGGYALKGPALSAWVTELFRVFGVNSFDALAGKPCRVEIIDGMARKVGHYLEDRWFDQADLPTLIGAR